MRALLLVTFGVLVLASAAMGQAGRKSVSAAEVTGTFEKKFPKKFRGSASEIKIAALGGGKLHVAMNLVYPYVMNNGELMANMGELDEKFAIDADIAAYTSEDGGCMLTIKFVKPGVINVEEVGSDAGCGFGHNVTAAGTYTKVSGKKPVFGER